MFQQGLSRLPLPPPPRKRWPSQVQGCFEAAATATGCKLEMMWNKIDGHVPEGHVSKMYTNVVTNSVMAESLRANISPLGTTYQTRAVEATVRVCEFPRLRRIYKNAASHVCDTLELPPKTYLPHSCRWPPGRPTWEMSHTSVSAGIDVSCVHSRRNTGRFQRASIGENDPKEAY